MNVKTVLAKKIFNNSSRRKHTVLNFMKCASYTNKLVKRMIIIKGHFFSYLKIHIKYKPSPKFIYIKHFFLKHIKNK